MLFWDPKPEIFTVPILHFPILWYSALFTLGFCLGIGVWTAIARRFLFNFPYYIESDILLPDDLSFLGKTRKEIADVLNAKISKNQTPVCLDGYSIFVRKSLKNRPFQVICRLSLDSSYKRFVFGLVKKVTLLADRLVIYVILGTIIGARVGHFIFYEDPKYYLLHPLEIFSVWSTDPTGLSSFVGFRGLASHGAFLGVSLGLYLFYRKYKKIVPWISFLSLLDFLAAPAALVGSLIRVGNFFNQEILGSPTTMPWGVVFGHPADHSALVPRHPVQIYEAIFYFFSFIILWKLSCSSKTILSKGKLSGLFMILIFGFRFFVEFWKEEQSSIVFTKLLNMGQLLSLPLVFCGVFFYCYSKKHKVEPAVTT